MGMESKYIWMNGELVEFAKATLHFLTPALHYGAGVFEGLRCYATDRGRAVFRPKEHLERLLDSARVFGFRELPYSVAELTDAIRLVVTANGFNECYIRPLLYLTDGGWNLTVDAGRASVALPCGSGTTIWAPKRWRTASAPTSPHSRATIRM